MKRLLSFLLVMSLVAGIAPTTVFATEKGNSLQYVFNAGAVGKSATVSVKDYTSYDDISTSVSPNRWKYVGAYGDLFSTANITPIYLQYSANGAETVGANAMVFMLEVDKSGTYKPSVTYTSRAYAGHSDLYLISEEDAKKIDLTTIDGINAAVAQASFEADSIVKHMASVDTNSNSSEDAKKGVYAENLKLEQGDYYLISVIRKGETASNHNSGRTYVEIKQIELQETEPKAPSFDRIEASFGEIYVGTKPEVKVTWLAGDAELDGTEGKVTLEILENEDGVLLKGRDGDIYAVAEGNARLRVNGELDGIIKTTEVEVAVKKEDGLSGADAEYHFYTDAYGDGNVSVKVDGAKKGDILSVENFSKLGVLEYTQFRPWSMVSTTAARPTSQGVYFSHTATYMDFSCNADEWVALKVKVPASGKYKIDMSARSKATDGRAEIYMLPYTDDMNLESVREKAESYMTAESLAADVDLYGTTGEIVRFDNIGEFVASDELDYSDGFAEYLMIIKSCKSRVSTGYYVLPKTIYLRGAAALAEAEVFFDGTEIGVGESACVKKITARNLSGDEVDISGAYIESRVADGSEEFIEISEDGKSFTAKAEGTATILTYVIMDGSVCIVETPIIIKDECTIVNAYIYGNEKYSVGDKLSLNVRLEQKNGKIISGGDIVEYEIISQSGNVIEISEDRASASIVGEGETEIRALISARGKILKSDIITIKSEKGKKYPANFTIDFRRNEYEGDSQGTLQAKTEYTDARNWKYYEMVNANAENLPVSLPSGDTYAAFVWDKAVLKNTTGYVAFKVYIPESGEYKIDSVGYCRNRAAKFELYIIPTSSEDGSTIEQKLVTDNEYYFGSCDHYREAAIYNELNTFGTNEISQAGEYFLVFKVVQGAAYEKNSSFGDAWYPLYLTFKSSKAMESAEIKTEKSSLLRGESLSAEVIIRNALGEIIEDGEDSASEVVWSSSDESVVSVSESGVITAVAEGKATVSVSVMQVGVIAEASAMISVEDTSGIDEEIGITLKSDKSSVYIYGETTLSAYATMNSGDEIKIPNEYVSWKIVEGEEYAELSDDGTLTGKDEGIVVIDAEINASWKIDAEKFDPSPIGVSIVWDATVDPQLYTLEMRENAKKNASKYQWASETVKAATKKADVYVEHMDELYDAVVPEGLPRYYFIGHRYDPKKTYCRYCEKDTSIEYGMYGFVANPLVNKWKVKCPLCKRLFPSNDFGSFYELGLSESGNWSYEKALQKHHEMFVCEDGEECSCAYPKAERGTEDWYAFYGYGVKGGYLNNDLYPEMDERLGVTGWAVDDGFGYMQPYISDSTLPGYDSSYYEGENGLAYYKNGTHTGPVRYSYIAYYLYEGLWFTSYDSASLISAALSSLRTAFVYTGDAKYGRAGAILLDKVADVYPSFDYYQWADFRGDNYRGSTSDPVRSTSVKSLPQAYDAFLPIYNDPYVVKFLSEHGARYETDENGDWKRDENGELIPINLKDSPGALRKNIEENLLLTIFDDVRKGKVWGNFGMHQSVVANTAVALNKMPETKEMLNWLLCDGSGYNTGIERDELIAGGSVTRHLIEEVDRDGIGNENSPNYNNTWITNLILTAETLAEYDGYTNVNLFNNPKFVKMFTAQIPLTLGGYYTAQIGDTASTASKGLNMTIANSVTAFKYTGNRMLAKAIYQMNGNSTKDIYGTIFDSDPGKIAKDIERIVKEDGELSLGSELLAGFGFAALRAGADNKSANVSTETNTIRDIGIYFGANTGHGHRDGLNLYMSAFGLNVAPDLGYPEQAGEQPNRYEWVRTTLSHNTVVVDEKEQETVTIPGTPHHFDDSGRVKVMEVSTDAYPQTEDYRRTVFMIDVNDDISYGVDFFRVLGGNDHLYSFHSQSDEIEVISGLGDMQTVPMYTDKDGNIYGTYAGADVKYGADPGGLNNAKYPRGYTWLKNIRSFESVDKDFSVEFKVKDWNDVMAKLKDIRLKLTMLNDEPVNEVTFATALPPQKTENKNIGELEYLLVRRKGYNNNLDTLFTSVLEPYEAGKVYIEKIEKVAMQRRKMEKPGLNDAFAAVKVTLKNGRTDYVIYSNNNNVTYLVDGKITFKGFAGVLSLENTDSGEAVVYKYLNDGTQLSIGDGEASSGTAAYTGAVMSFTKDLEFKNSIVYAPDQAVEPSELCGKYVYIDNDSQTNAVYKIESAEETPDGNILLDIGVVTLAESIVRADNVKTEYSYNISEGQSLRIPITELYTSAPMFEAIRDKTTTAESTITIKFNAESPLGKDLTFIGTSIPRGMTIDEEKMTLTWKPSASQIGENHVAITATDGILETTEHFYITVYGSTTGGGAGNSESGSAGTPNTPGTSTPTIPPTQSGEKDDNAGSTDNAGDGDSNVPQTPSSGEAGNVRFIDLGNHAWAADAINSLADEGIIKGTTPNTFSPAANITRADFAILLVRAFELASENEENFADVNAFDYFAKELAVARNTGLVNGIGENKFAPRNNITRQDMMVIVYRALTVLGVKLETADIDFPDFTSVAEYAKEAVKALTASRLVNGKSGCIAPTDYTTRAEVAVLLKRILDFLKQ